MWAITHRKWPEEPEEYADALSEQFIEMIPMVGKTIIDISEGWSTEVPLTVPLKAPGTGLAVIKRGLGGGDWEMTDAEKRRMLEGFSIGFGLPYTGARRAYQSAEQGSISPMFGPGEKKKKKSSATIRF
jgi:hypothetical protein